MLAHYFRPTFNIIVLLTLISKQVLSSGVFELELIKFQPLDVRPTLNNNNANNSKIELANHEEQNNFIRVLVCLKEAFTSNLDGPCTFGNGSITLSQDSVLQQEVTNHLALSNSIKSQESIGRQSHIHNSTNNQQQQQQQAGFLMTNIVRILFTFRWTKSFTIILTAEEARIDDDKQLLTSNLPFSGQATRWRLQENSGNRTTISKPIGKQDFVQIKGPSYIDRHVLTENEVLPNLDSNPNKPWSSRFSRSLKSSLAYKFRVYCSLNYYGDGCTTFCRARDDQFGHYNCSTTGQKICLDGWSGPDCERAKCRPGCNQQHGYCEKPDTCQCRPGWTGARCDECIIYPGCQNGYCLSPWQCICQRNWGGVLCDQDLNYCGTHEPCKNNGTCQNIAPGKFKCNCLDGFTGVDCDLNLNSSGPINGISSPANQFAAGCAQNPCLNGGICYGFNNLLVDSPMIGPPSVESSNPDGEQEPDRFYRCQCAPGYTGDYCQWSDSALGASIILPLDGLVQINETTTTATITTSTNETSHIINLFVMDKNESTTNPNAVPNPTLYIESSQQTLPSTHHVNIKHFISGVLIASVAGVFLASLFLAWCCLMAIKRNRISFIQMNVVRSEDGLDQTAVSSTLRRMHEKIRDSFRRPSRHRIKPETKLSIENVLRPPQPPPSYEESKNYGINKLSPMQQYSCQEYGGMSTNSSEDAYVSKLNLDQNNLVIGETLERKSISITSSTQPDLTEINSISDAYLSCPKHSHLYRQQAAAQSFNEGNFPQDDQRQSSDCNHLNRTNHNNYRQYHIH